MTHEKFIHASDLCEEINRLDMLIHQIEGLTTIDLYDSDYGYLVNLLGEDNVLRCMRTRKRILEKEFEEL